MSHRCRDAPQYAATNRRKEQQQSMTAPGMAACVEVVGRKKAPMVNGFLDISAQTLALNERRKDPEQSVPNTLSNITDRFKYTLHLKKAYELKDQPLVVSMLAVVPLENGELIAVHAGTSDALLQFVDEPKFMEFIKDRLAVSRAPSIESKEQQLLARLKLDADTLDMLENNKLDGRNNTAYEMARNAVYFYCYGAAPSKNSWTKLHIIAPHHAAQIRKALAEAAGEEVPEEEVNKAYEEVVDKLKKEIGWNGDGFGRKHLGKIYSDPQLKDWFLKTMVPRVRAKVKEVVEADVERARAETEEQFGGIQMRELDLAHLAALEAKEKELDAKLARVRLELREVRERLGDDQAAASSDQDAWETLEAAAEEAGWEQEMAAEQAAEAAGWGQETAAAGEAGWEQEMAAEQAAEAAGWGQETAAAGEAGWEQEMVAEQAAEAAGWEQALAAATRRVVVDETSQALLDVRTKAIANLQRIANMAGVRDVGNLHPYCGLELPFVREILGIQARDKEITFIQAYGRVQESRGLKPLDERFKQLMAKEVALKSTEHTWCLNGLEAGKTYTVAQIYDAVERQNGLREEPDAPDLGQPKRAQTARRRWQKVAVPKCGKCKFCLNKGLKQACVERARARQALEEQQQPQPEQEREQQPQQQQPQPEQEREQQPQPEQERERQPRQQKQRPRQQRTTPVGVRTRRAAEGIQTRQAKKRKLSA